jgi:hypothetical protein
MKRFFKSLLISVIIFGCIFSFQRLDLPGREQVANLMEYTVMGEYNWNHLKEKWSVLITENFSLQVSRLQQSLRNLSEVLSTRDID